MRNIGSKGRALTPEDVALLERITSNFLQWPPAFKAALINWLGPELQITQSQIISPTTTVLFGSGSPEGVQAAGIGSLYLRLDGGAGTTVYFKESGTGTSGWVARDVFTNGLTVSDAKDITIAAGTGSKIGQSGSKIGFYGATPVAKPGATSDVKDALVALGLLTDGGATPLNLDAGALTAGAVTASGVTLADATDVTINATTGSKIGQSGSKIGFYGAAPVVQRSAYTQTYATADRTHAAPTASTLTLADGVGTTDNTIGAITADASVVAAVQELADEVNKLVADLADVKQLVNSVIDDLQALGLAT